jgi:hypothetical protein
MEELHTDRIDGGRLPLYRPGHVMGWGCTSNNNKLKLEKFRFRKGDLVYLLRRNIKTTKPSEKLNYRKFGLFKVKRNIKDINYKLHLLLTIKIYPVFHVSLLKPANSDTLIESIPKIYFNLQEEVYTVKKILKIRKQRKTL